MLKKVSTDLVFPAVDPGPWGKPKGGGNSGGPGGGWPPSGRGRGNPQNEFEDLIRDAKRAFKKWFEGGSGNRGIVTVIAAIGLLWLTSGVYQLQPGGQGVVLRFGKFDRLATSGLRYHLPAPFESVDVVNTEAVRMETLGGDVSAPPHGGSTGTGEDEILMLTGDENIINLSFNVQWKVHDAKAFVFNVANPEGTVRSVTESAMREIIGRTKIESALTEGKSKVQEDTRSLTQATLDRYNAGIQILQVNLLDASFPQAVVDAARDVQAARADQERARNEAQAYTNDILPRARGQASHIIQDAEAYKQKVVADAEGSAARFTSVYDQYKKAADVTRKRMYLETMEKILTGTNKVIIDNHTGALPYLPLPAVRGHDEESDQGKEAGAK